MISVAIAHNTTVHVVNNMCVGAHKPRCTSTPSSIATMNTATTRPRSESTKAEMLKERPRFLHKSVHKQLQHAK